MKLLTHAAIGISLSALLSACEPAQELTPNADLVPVSPAVGTLNGAQHAWVTAEKIALGRILFHDESLSEPAGQSCARCHNPETAYSDPGSVVSPGADNSLFGNRNAPSLAYIRFNPDLYWNEEEELWMGGFFLDGRVATFQEQAVGPLLNPLEMANHSAVALTKKLQNASYKEIIGEIYGAAIWEDPNAVIAAISESLAAYQFGPDFALFTSKYDAYLQGNAELSEQEQFGLELFEAEDKGNCAACHLSRVESHSGATGALLTLPLFTDYSYDNLGAAFNPGLPFLAMNAEHNPAGVDYRDNGMGDNPLIDNAANEAGKFKVSTLRNIELTPPYMHNGVFETLEEVVQFYNRRDIEDHWGPPEIDSNVNDEELGDLGLSEAEEQAIVSFMKTLTDGYLMQ